MSNQHYQGQSVLEAIRTPRRRLRVFAVSICVLLVNALLAPQIFAIGEEAEKERQANAIVLRGTNEQKINQGLLKVQEVAARKQARLTERVQNESGILDNVLTFVGLSQLQLEDLEQIRELASLLEEEHQQAVLNFAQTRESLVAKGLAPVIVQRHDETVERYINEYAEMTARLQALQDAGSLLEQQDAADALHGFMKDQKLKKRHQFTDPNKLPWGSPDAEKTRKPAETAEELEQLTGISPLPQGIQLAANVITPDMLGNPGGPVAEDLEETPDIKLTDAIRAKAEELDHDPVKIYNWVRNTIEFIPSYGSIQGADYTLQSGKGNAFDTASLLIALYRAANIPARYAYGTIDVPADQVMNWVGGVEVPEAAQQLLGQGGIPNVAMVSGGKISHIRMEHVWVEAWIDYLPSRGARHQVGDSWIPLDASFKQYEFTEGLNLENNVPFDAQGLADQIAQNATVDQTAGYVQGIDEVALETAFNTYRQQIEDYINAQNPSATTDEVLGTHKVIVEEHVQLAAGLPYELVARTLNYSTLPGSLRHKFRYTLGTAGYGAEVNRLITFERALPEISGRKHALSFRPSSQEDESVLNSYLPDPDPATGEIDPNQIPRTLPGYLINMTAEFTQDGDMVHSAAAGTMGAELYETLALWSPSQGWQQAVNNPTVGEYRTIGLDLQGVNPQEAVAIESTIASTKSIVDSGDSAQIATLTKNEVVGNILYATIYSYLILNDIQDELAAKSANVVTYRLPSFGVFTTSLQTSYWFGVPRDVSSAGLVIDVDHLATQSVAKDNDRQRTVGYIRGSGVRASAYEHIVPERMFSTEQNPVQGISAVKALAIAAAQGQKIWTIDRDNLSLALASINLDSSIENDIRNSVLAGNIATVHESPINFSTGTNTGYLLIDPETGAGAYKIAGGQNGGILFGLFLLAFLGVMVAVASALAGAAALILAAPLLFFSLLLLTFVFGQLELAEALGAAAFIIGALAIFAVLGPLIFWVGLIVGFIAVALTFLTSIYRYGREYFIRMYAVLKEFSFGNRLYYELKTQA